MQTRLDLYRGLWPNVMRLRNTISVGLLLIGGLGAAMLGLYSRARSPVEAIILRDAQYGADQRIITLQLTNRDYVGVYFLDNHQQFQARLGNRWTDPQDLYGSTYPPWRGGLACIVPSQAEACRLLLVYKRDPPALIAARLLSQYGLAERFPKLYRWVDRRIPIGYGPWRHSALEVPLPRQAPGCAPCRIR
jgi:hypothetical protein